MTSMEKKTVDRIPEPLIPVHGFSEGFASITVSLGFTRG